METLAIVFALVGVYFGIIALAATVAGDSRGFGNMQNWGLGFTALAILFAVLGAAGV